MSDQIRFNVPLTAGREQEYIAQAIRDGRLSGDYQYTKKCHQLLEQVLSVPKALLTTSCTHALEMCALLLDIAPGDEIIAPSFTFSSSVNAFVLRGAAPVFADIRPDTLNIDEGDLEALITERTKAIIVVHYAGVGCEMGAIMDIANRYQVPVIEDNAHGLFGRYRGKHLGTFGPLATQSFHETKNFTCGEGGALLINDPAYIERAEILREKGTNRSRFFRGQVDKYSWVDLGSSYLPSDMLAAHLFAQLECWQKVQADRQRVWETYNRALRGWAEANEIRLPIVPEHCDQAYHMYYLLLPSLTERQRVIGHLREQDIVAVFHYLPLHLSAMGTHFGGRPGDCPVAEYVSDRLLRLPFYAALTPQDQDRVISGLLSCYAC